MGCGGDESRMGEQELHRVAASHLGASFAKQNAPGEYLLTVTSSAPPSRIPAAASVLPALSIAVAHYGQQRQQRFQSHRAAWNCLCFHGSLLSSIRPRRRCPTLPTHLAPGGRNVCPASGSVPPKKQFLELSSIPRFGVAQCARSAPLSMVNG